MYSRTILGNRLRYRVPLNCFGPVNPPNLPDLPCSLKKCGRSVGFPHSRGGHGSPQWDHGEEDSQAGDTPRIGNAGALHAHSSREHATRYELAPPSGLEEARQRKSVRLESLTYKGPAKQKNPPGRALGPARSGFPESRSSLRSSRFTPPRLTVGKSVAGETRPTPGIRIEIRIPVSVMRAERGW